MAFRVAYNLSQSPLVVSETGTVLAVASYGAVSTTDDRFKRLQERDPAPLRLLTPSELKPGGKDKLPAEVQAAVDAVAELEAAAKAPPPEGEQGSTPAAAPAADTTTRG